jgi:hypothetical protein
MTINFLKTSITIFGVVLLFTSCQKNEDTSYDAQGIDELTSTNAMTPMEENPTCYITAGVVDRGPCGNPQVNDQENNYSIYVTSGSYTVPYYRDVSVAVVHENTWVDTKILRIPANEHLSEQELIVQDASESYGLITLDVINVKKSNGEYDLTCQLRDTSPIINNCYYVAPEPQPGFEPCAKDSDGDGICDSNDPTPNGTL